jgi:membrane protease subunit HflK
MPWNEPGGNSDNKNKDPWGNKDKQSPPDLDKIIADVMKKVREMFSFQKSGKIVNSEGKPSNKDHHYGFGVTALVLLVLWFISGFYIVNPAEEAVILRLGQYSDVTQPGLHWMARFIDSKYVIDVQKIYSFSLQGDFLTKSSDQNDLPNQYIQVDTTKKNPNESDQSKNLVNVELNVQYRITNPRAYLFNVVNPDDTVQQVASGALSDMIGKMKLDDVLTTGREFLSSGVLDRTREVLKNYNVGLEVVAVTLKKVQAPDQVRAAFNDVNRADQDRSTTIQQAQAYASKVVPIAQGAAARILADANGYQQQVVLTAQANIARYQALQQAYTQSPDITRERMYLEAMQNIFTHTTKILVDFNSSNNMLYLPLNKLIRNSEQKELAATTQSAAMVDPNSANNTEVKNDTN